MTVVLIAGCSQSLYMQGRRHLENDRYDPAIDAFYAEIAAHPTNYKAWRELGVAFFEKDNLTKAEDALGQAGKIKPDARTQLYLGMIHESRDDFRAAIQAYSIALGLDSRGATADLVRVRRDALVTKQIEAEVALAMENEAAIDVDTIPAQTLSVADFDGSNLPPDLAPLARGLTDFTASDLAKVTSLTILERQRLAAVLQELEFSQSGFVDPATAPRVGKLMGSRRMITATLLSSGDDDITIDGAVVDAVEGTTRRTEPLENSLDNIFALQKQFVFEILDKLGVELTIDERDDISAVPTESYLAFLAYSRGLDFEDRGMLPAAKREYASAVKQDPGFANAQRNLTATSVTIESGPAGNGTVQQFEASVQENNRREEAGSELGGRLAHLAVTGGLIPTIDTDGNIPTIAPPLGGGGTGSIAVRGTLDAN
jgi:tetratricopeptide (TPR) repeat protein